MKNSIIAFSVSCLAMVGCIKDDDFTDTPGPTPQGKAITLNVDGLSHRTARATGEPEATRAPLDEWENTPVSIGYMFDTPGDDYYDRSLTVTVEDVDDENDGQLIKTGMEYPSDHSDVRFRGYYPVASPNAAGAVTYDISKGDVDVMMSNPVSGNIGAPITGTLLFEHQLTRITFLLVCKEGGSYPEPIFGVRADASTDKPLGTAVTLELGSSDAPVFKIWGGVFRGDYEGFVIPRFGLEPVVLDMMVQPGVPLTFTVVSLTGSRSISIDSDSLGIWSDLTTAGGQRGVQYTVQLGFSGENILAQNITVDSWTQGEENVGGNSGVWW